MAKRLDPKVAEEVMLKAGLKPLEPYEHALAKWKCLHLACGEVVYPKYNSIQSGGGGCRKCSTATNKLKSRLSQEEVDTRLKAKGLVALEEYVNSSTGMNCKCLKCGNIQIVKFEYINQVHGCAKCGLKLGGLKGRVSQEKAVKTMQSLNLEPLEPYELSGKKWKCRCLQCGSVVYPTYIGATGGLRGCTKCGYLSSAESRRTPQEDALEVLKRAGFEPLAPYKNAHTKWKSKCIKCGKTSNIIIASLKHQKSGCRFCAPNAPIDSKTAIRIMKKSQLKPLEPFTTGKSKWKCECLRCGRIVHPSFSKVQMGQSGCRHCGYLISAGKNRTPESEAVAVMIQAQLKPLEPYTGDGSKWKCACLKCGQIVYPMLTNIKQKNGGCMYCAMKGIDFHKPAYLYLLTHTEFGSLKVGVGNSQEGKKNDRIKKLQKFGWEVHKRWDFDTGAEAYGYEQIVLSHLRKDLGLPVYLTLDLMKKTGGHTETVDADSISLLQLERIINRVIKGLQK
jgi:DNA-directed RNA polymerase subunit M/transcription elongation factor TFIIS